MTMRLSSLICLLMLWSGFALQAQTLPPKPDRYFTDQAHVVDPGAGEQINQQLEQFEKDTSSQFLVVIYPQLPTGVDMAQYATNIFNSWKIGQKGKDNGVILFVFFQDHQMFIAPSRDLEGALPDATCKNIITQEIVPRFRQNDYAGGIQAGVNAIIAATKGEYQGAGTTVRDREGVNGGLPLWAIILIIILFIVLRAYIFPRGGSGPFIYTGGGYGGGGGWSGGGGSSGGGGFSSGGGGSSSGGGAGGSW
jgi:uncharacterized protein